MSAALHGDGCLGEVVIRLRDRGPEPAWHEDRELYGPWYRFEAELASAPEVRALGMTPWEAVHGLVSNGRAELERRWAGVAVSERCLQPDAVLTLGEWEVPESGERVELACVVLAGAGSRCEGVLDVVRRELPGEVREFARWVLEAWGSARGHGR
jgi:hypothetical protein